MTVNHGVPGSSPGEGAESRTLCVAFFVFMHFVYIIKSDLTGHYYIGETPNCAVRLEFHNDPIKNTNTTKLGIPWAAFWSLPVRDKSIARKIEAHIKRMKSRKYIE